MPSAAQAIDDFLAQKRIAVAGVSRAGNTPADAIFRRLAESGHEVVPVNPNASEIEGRRCYPSVAAIGGPVDAVVVVTLPSVSGSVAEAALARGVKHIWFHRSFGGGSVSP